ncbi:MAG: hydantoinase/oxoprolinase family protein [Mariprofundaceae bacterium]
MLLGVDTGGTFTDFVALGPQGLRFHKVLSTPDNPARAILRGVHELGLDPAGLHVVHGTTVATNAILERKGARVLFVTHRGLEDMLRIGRQQRRALYDLTPIKPHPWFRREDTLGVGGRIGADGAEIEPLTGADLEALRARLPGYEAVAICLLFPFLDDRRERELAAAVEPMGAFVSRSGEILPQAGEYERAATTWLNAYVGPLVGRYLNDLQRGLKARNLLVMHSAGGVMGCVQAARHAVRLALSGPAGGLVAAAAVGRELASEGAIPEARLLSFDMGGTSTDVALVESDLTARGRAEVAGLPVAVPMLDIHTIGAGGGSISWRDAAGLPQVGPESAGADPGPVCYGRGGTRPTVTDANLALGRLPAEARLAGSMPLDRDAALRALADFGRPLGMDALEAARAVIRLAEEQMAGALRVVSVQRGVNPAGLALCAFGGAGGLHACALAGMLGMRRVVAPLGSGAFSALGMLMGERRLTLARSVPGLLDEAETASRIEAALAALKAEAARQMPGQRLRFTVEAELRYRGQGETIAVPFVDAGMEPRLPRLGETFCAAHEAEHGHVLARPIELSGLRLTAVAEGGTARLPALPQASGAPEVDGASMVDGLRAPLVRREVLRPGHRLAGPALIVEPTATFWLPPAWTLRVSRSGHLLMTHEEDE